MLDLNLVPQDIFVYQIEILTLEDVIVLQPVAIRLLEQPEVVFYVFDLRVDFQSDTVNLELFMSVLIIKDVLCQKLEDGFVG